MIRETFDAEAPTIQKLAFDNRPRILVDSETGEPARIGQELTTFRGETVRLCNARPPHKASSAGFIYVTALDPSPGERLLGGFEYYPSVCGLAWVELVSEREG